MGDEKKINNEYKSTLFATLLSSEEFRPDLLGLYNVLNGSDYTDPGEIEITTIENVIYIGRHNDMSFMLDKTMSLYEHQSTVNPNMPVRGLIYFAKLYDGYISSRHLPIFNTRLVRIPAPSYYVFYNGTTDEPDRTELKLSDAFMMETEDSFYEWTAVMLNINQGHNPHILNACKVLNDYSILIGKIREYSDTGMPIAEAVTSGVKWCRENDVLADYLTRHEAEVNGVILEEFDEQLYIENVRKIAREDALEEGKAEGRAEGRTEGITEGLAAGKAEALLSLVKEGHITAEVAAEKLELSVEEITARIK